MRYLLLFALLHFCLTIPDCSSLPTPYIKSNVRIDNILTDGKKLIGSWTNEDHSTHELERHAHIVVFLEVNANCTVTPPTQIKVDFIHASGAHVVGSLGGFGMDTIWPVCSVHYLSTQLVDILRLRDLDGIQIDYQHEPQDIDFLIQLFASLRSALPEAKHVTIANENRVMVQMPEYLETLTACAGTAMAEVDFYNDMTHSVSDVYQKNHYLEIVKEMYGAQATQAIFGTCIVGCVKDDAVPEPQEDGEEYYQVLTCTVKPSSL